MENRLAAALRHGMRTLTLHRALHNGSWIALISFESGQITVRNGDVPMDALDAVLGPPGEPDILVARRTLTQTVRGLM